MKWSDSKACHLCSWINACCPCPAWIHPVLINHGNFTWLLSLPSSLLFPSHFLEQTPVCLQWVRTDICCKSGPPVEWSESQLSALSPAKEYVPVSDSVLDTADQWGRVLPQGRSWYKNNRKDSPQWPPTPPSWCRNTPFFAVSQKRLTWL